MPAWSSTSRTSSPCSSTRDAGSPDGTQRVVIETEPPDYVESILLVRPTNRLDRVTLTYPEIDGVGGKGAALRTIFEIAAALEVQALVVVDSDLRSIVPEWIELLAGPILKGGYDYVAPLYARYKYDGTITNTVTYPLTRALYGHRIRQPIGGDFGVSRRPRPALPRARRLDRRHQQVRHRHLDDDVGADRRLRGLPDAPRGEGPRSQGSRARTSGRCSARSWARSCASPRPTRTPGSTSAGRTTCPAYGFERIIDPPPLEVNSIRLLSEFHAGSLTLADTWRRMLDRANLRTRSSALAAEAGRLAEAASRRLGLGGEDAPPRRTTLEMAEALAAFHFPDDLWARVIYDLVLAVRRGEPGDRRRWSRRSCRSTSGASAAS